MHFSIVQVRQTEGIFIRSFGQFRPTDMQALFKTLKTFDFYNGARILHDMRNVDFSVPVEQVVKVAHARPSEHLTTHLALVAGTEVGFGMLRVIVAIRENASRDTNAFRSIDDAMQWLNIPRLGTTMPVGVESTLSQHTPLKGEMNETYGLVFHKMSLDDAMNDTDSQSSVQSHVTSHGPHLPEGIQVLHTSDRA